MDINEPSLMDVAHDTINSTQGPALIEVADSPSLKEKGRAFFVVIVGGGPDGFVCPSLANRIPAQRHSAPYRSRSVFATAGEAVVEAKPIATPTIKDEIGPLLKDLMEWPTQERLCNMGTHGWKQSFLMVLISGRNNQNKSPGCLNAELLTLLVRMGVHPKVFPDRMHTYDRKNIQGKCPATNYCLGNPFARLARQTKNRMIGNWPSI
ncbi:unnamed protein product [Vicia faba]|uniref:Uncharacterized protein n=1 Tax=Vicia faba TaxID=3906 RepID=A0AAV1A9Q9_VICFA|nr:unnamed protein product [Vicia faba]